MTRNSRRSGTGPRSARTPIACWIVPAPVSSSCRSIRTASSTASWRSTLIRCARAPTARRTSPADPAAAATPRAGRPVKATAAAAPQIAATTSAVIRREASSHCQPDAEARATSRSHVARTFERSTAAPAVSTIGLGRPIDSAAIAIAAPAPIAAATSSIEAVQQARGVGDPTKLAPQALGHRLPRSDPMPLAIVAECDELLDTRPAIVETADAADRQQAPGALTHAGRTLESCIQDEIDGVDNLAQDRLRPRRLLVAEGHPHETRQGFARAV